AARLGEGVRARRHKRGRVSLPLAGRGLVKRRPYFRRCLGEATERISLDVAPPKIAKALIIPEDTKVLTLVRVGHLKDGRPAQASSSAIPDCPRRAIERESRSMVIHRRSVAWSEFSGLGRGHLI